MSAPKNGTFWIVGINCPDADYNVPSGAAAQSYIQDAINAADTSDWKEVLLLEGEYKMNPGPDPAASPLEPKSSVKLRGSGMNKTVITETPDSSWAISNEKTSGQQTSIEILSYLIFLLNSVEQVVQASRYTMPLIVSSKDVNSKALQLTVGTSNLER